RRRRGARRAARAPGARDRGSRRRAAPGPGRAGGVGRRGPPGVQPRRAGLPDGRDMRGAGVTVRSPRRTEGGRVSTSEGSGPGRGHRRRAILEAAADLFSERGYPATGVDEIGEAAGITGPAVYRHFDNKNHVLSAVVKRAIERVVEGVADVVSEAGTSWEVLE